MYALLYLLSKPCEIIGWRRSCRRGYENVKNEINAFKIRMALGLFGSTGLGCDGIGWDGPAEVGRLSLVEQRCAGLP
jgi:hypothetical protein